MSRQTKRRSYAQACLVLVAALPVISGGECSRLAQDYTGPGDVPPNPENCTIPAEMLPNATTVPPTHAVCAENPDDRESPCQCEDYGGELPFGVVLPLDTNPRGCHREAFNRGGKYILPGCAQIAEASGRVMDYEPFTDAYSDEDTSVVICPDSSTMRVDPFSPDTTMELRTEANFTRATPTGNFHMEVQDCRWYDGYVTIEANALHPDVGKRVFSSRPTPFVPLGDVPAPDMISGDVPGSVEIEWPFAILSTLLS